MFNLVAELPESPRTKRAGSTKKAPRAVPARPIEPTMEKSRSMRTEANPTAMKPTTEVTQAAKSGAADGAGGVGRGVGRSHPVDAAFLIVDEVENGIVDADSGKHAADDGGERGE